MEPDRRTLRTPLATGFWREFNEWEERVAVARRQKRIGDILLLTEEISNPLCKEDAVAQAGLALRELGRHELALQEYRKGLAVNSKHVEFRREEAVILNRMGRVDEAIIKLERLLVDEPSDTRSTGCLGRIYTSIWKKCWIGIDDIEERRQAAFDAYQWVIKSIDTYLRGFHFDLNVHEPGIKALNMSCLLLELADRFDHADDPDPDIRRIRHLLPELQSTLGLTLKASAAAGAPDYWTYASLAEWHLVRGDSVRTVVRAYRKSLSYARKNLFHLRSSLKQLKLFCDLGLHEEASKTAEAILLNEIDRIEAVDADHREREYPLPQTAVLAFLFTGHRLDRKNSEARRFPADLEQEVRRQIDMSLDRGNADWNDHGFVSGAACGGDIIFIETCLDRGMRVHVHMPCTDADFISEQVAHGGDQWIARFYAIRNNPKVNMYYQQERVGRAREGVDPCDRNARWTLYSSLVLGIEKLRLIALWDGKSATADDEDGRYVGAMVAHAQRMGCILDHLDITKLEYLFAAHETVDAHDRHARLKIDDRVELLRKVSLFSSLHHVDLTQIALVTEERQYEDEALLASIGEQGDELFIIAQGEVSVRVPGEDGPDRTIACRCAGDYVGEMAIVHDEIRTASLVANGDVLILALSQVNFRKILRDRPETGFAVTRTLADRLIEASRFDPGEPATSSAPALAPAPQVQAAL
ncbi:MAG: cyclic nucleotide-binding domain-containing protein [Granulosicoccus sp.]|nr:cyclic nucleotide-binding domain-containing protein [Granulosicoccus sp.]